MTIGIESSSKPAYGQLAWGPAQRHIVVSDEAGLVAIERLLATACATGDESIRVYVLGREHRIGSPLRASTASLEVHAEGPGFSSALSACMDTAPAASRLYVAGSESFLSLVRRLASDRGLAADTMLAELAGSGARRAQCVHCKTVSDDIAYRAFDCARCHVTLIVRDHYSRRIGAYQAVVLHPSDPNIPALRQELL
ncbi:dimethylamine monooxygenase subunit DmmA family protein [Mesorhizobium sp.]|uniref:dimethylamine monooxygenase subunit DmmA family protein n=1 Tax=Mesorhizobium sp. TaxID=1871066 RepID=UPI0025FF966F|nr:dimethylamine monooxygenase subunit DmmA family protein [Mesorhizobium sp.]